LTQTYADFLTTVILAEQFRRAGLPSKAAFIREYTRKPTWVLRKSWTTAERADFRAWVVKVLRKRREEQAEQTADSILRMWGWTVKD